MTGYTRQKDAEIQPGQPANAGPLKSEFDTLQAAFNAATGHEHDGTLGDAPKIDLTKAVTGILPIANGRTDPANIAATGGTINGVIIGGVTPAAGSFTALVGTTAVLSGILSVDDLTNATSGLTGSIHTDGGLGVAKDLWIAGNTTLVGVTTLTGAATLAGIFSVDNTTDSTSAITGSIHTDGGLGVAKDIFVGVKLITDTIAEKTLAAGVTIDSVLLKDGAITANIITDTISEKTTAAGVTIDSVLLKDNSVSAGSMSTDTISEDTVGLGVTIDSVLLKDNKVTATSINTDTISEKTSAAGVTIDSVLLRDNKVTAASVNTDTISEKTSAAGVTIDSVLLRDNSVTAASVGTDTISEKTAAAGVTIDSVLLRDNKVTATSINTDTISEKTVTLGVTIDSVLLKDNKVTALDLISTGTTDSTSTITGALRTAGGLGVAKQLRVGGNATFSGTGAFTGATTIGGILSVDDVTQSTSTITGSIHTDGGLGVAKNTFLGGTLTSAGVLSVDDVTDSTSTTTGSIHTDGGLGVVKQLRVGGNTTLSGTTTLTGDATFAGILSVDNVTQSTSTLTGSIHTDGGLGVVKQLRVGGNAIFSSLIAVQSGQQVYFDGGSNTFIDEVSADKLRFVTGGTQALSLDSVQNATFAADVLVLGDLTGKVKDASTVPDINLTHDAHANTTIRSTSASATIFNISNNAGAWKAGDIITLLQEGTGQMTITIEGGIGFTLNVPSNRDAKSRTQFSMLAIQAISPTSFVVGGDMVVI